MRVATRTGLSALAAAALVLVVLLALASQVLPAVLQDRVDAQLEERAELAPILVAVADRLATSELSGAVEGARVARDGSVIELGQLPDEPLPPVVRVGFSTASADGERWRLLALEVVDVPRPGDEALVQLVASLGDVDAQARDLRRRLAATGLVIMVLAGLLGYWLGRRATRSLSDLRTDADALDVDDPATWQVRDGYGAPEVDDVAGALNTSLSSLAEQSERRTAALEAARAFASSATHELRTPLQSALTNLDIARSPLADDEGRTESVELAHRQLQRMAAGLAAVRALADAEFADLSWFVPIDLSDVVDEAIADERRREGVEIEVIVEQAATIPLWRDGVRLAIGNVVRNAIDHGRVDGRDVSISVRVAGATVAVDDDGPGIPMAERERLLDRFEKGSASRGSGLGLAIAKQVAVAHGGSVEIGDAAAGGASVTLRFGQPPG